MKVSNFCQEHLFLFQANELFCNVTMQCWTVQNVDIYLMIGGVALVE
jgi:hypothetical protein